MGDWADEKAREWSEETARCEMKVGTVGFAVDLAALLREVRASGALMVRAEILREVEKP